MADLRSRIPAAAPTAVVMVGAAGGFVRVLMSNWREGAVILGVALLTAAVFRLVLTPEQAGVLTVRSRVVDVLCYGVPGVLLIVLAVTIVRGHITLG